MPVPKKWKKYLFSGLSGLVVGAVALLARRSRPNIGTPEAIPDDTDFRIRTEAVRVQYRGQPYRSRTVYHCEPTQFKVWSFLRSPQGTDPEDGAPSARIYHVTPTFEYRSMDGEEIETAVQEQFYATIHAWSEKYGTISGHAARGAFAEFRTCHVGGSMNGVETGEKVLSPAPIEAPRFGSPASSAR